MAAVHHLGFDGLTLGPSTMTALSVLILSRGLYHILVPGRISRTEFLTMSPSLGYGVVVFAWSYV